MQIRNWFARLMGAACLSTLLGLTGSASAQILELNQLKANPAVGSWLGRAVPVAGTTACPVGSTGCPIPSEIVMLFTIHGDGTMVAIDSNIFKGGNHTTAHGQWVPRGYGVVHATFSLLQESNGIFIGGFKNLFDGAMSDYNNMTGRLHAYFYSYTDAQGNVIVGSDGLPSPNPLTPPAACSSQKNCAYLADFSFVAQRIQVEN